MFGTMAMFFFGVCAGIALTILVGFIASALIYVGVPPVED